MPRPVISFLTDFGLDSAPAICRGVILSIAPDAQIVDISHDIRKYAIRDGAYLLWTTAPWMPIGIHLVVVDPGVGTARLPIAILTRRGDILVGPDNGVLLPAAIVLGGAIEARVLENQALMLPQATSTFHGRDVFAPMAAHLAIGAPFDSVGAAVGVGSLVQLGFPSPVPTDDGGLATEVLYVDTFGNVRLAATPPDIEAVVGRLAPGRPIRATIPAANGRPVVTIEARWALTFGEQRVGVPLAYRDSSGQVALAENQGDLAGRHGIRSGDAIRLHSPSS